MILKRLYFKCINYFFTRNLRVLQTRYKETTSIIRKKESTDDEENDEEDLKEE